MNVTTGPYRKKARTDFKAIFALSRVGGDNKKGYFYFKSMMHMEEYERILRGTEADNGRDGVHSNGTQVTETPGGQHKGRVGRNYAQNNRRFSRTRTL